LFRRPVGFKCSRAPSCLFRVRVNIIAQVCWRVRFVVFRCVFFVDLKGPGATRTRTNDIFENGEFPKCDRFILVRLETRTVYRSVLFFDVDGSSVIWRWSNKTPCSCRYSTNNDTEIITWTPIVSWNIVYYCTCRFWLFFEWTIVQYCSKYGTRRLMKTYELSIRIQKYLLPMTIDVDQSIENLSIIWCVDACIYNTIPFVYRTCLYVGTSIVYRKINWNYMFQRYLKVNMNSRFRLNVGTVI
jgi:hypothetical protein